jgi:hypothetical protein
MSVVLLKLNKHQQNLLIEVLSKRGQGAIIQEKGGWFYCEASDRDKLRQLVLDEFCDTGLKVDDEPNARGLDLEDLIDAMGYE